jgi:hypothetical protein
MITLSVGTVAMNQISNLSSTKFGICIDHNTAFTPSFAGICLLFILHISSCSAIWILHWPFLFCLLINLAILCLMIYSIDRYIFRVAAYRFRFFFEDKEGWLVQEVENGCYRAKLQFAFCSQYLVILGLSKQEGFTAAKIKHRQKLCILPIFFDSLPAHEFRQLRKVLIVLDYSV